MVRSLQQFWIKLGRYGVRLTTVLKDALGVEHTRVEGVGWGGGPQLVVSVRPVVRREQRCPWCRRRCARYDLGNGRRCWRAPDFGVLMVYLEAPAPRVRCREHGVVVAAVPWARPGSRFTYAFEDTVSWLCANMTGSKVAELMRTTWRSVQEIVARVVTAAKGRTDRLGGLRRIGIDEISYKKGQHYLTIVVDHDTGRIVWSGQGRNSDTLATFFADLGPDRAGSLSHVSADGAEWIHRAVREHATQVAICLDAFHIVSWAIKALEKLRRRMGAEFRAGGRHGQASTIKHTRWALIKKPEDLGPNQRATVAELANTNHPLYRAYLIKEQLREVFHSKGTAAHRKSLLAGLIAWCARSRIPEFVALGKTLRHYRQLIINTIEHGLSNARSEATNTHLRALTKRANGFHTPEALIAQAELTRGGLCPALPGHTTA